MDESAEVRAAIAAWPIATICAELALSETARALLAEAPAAPAYLAALLRAECHRDAVSFLAHALARPQAVRWACDCVEAGVAGLSQPARVALTAARSWAIEPEPVRCRDAATAAEQPGLDREVAARFAAFGAAWSGASLAPEGHPAVVPAPTLGARAVAAAVMLAASDARPGEMGARLRDFIGRGMLSARRATAATAC
jgi:hypothetical protein